MEHFAERHETRRPPFLIWQVVRTEGFKELVSTETRPLVLLILEEVSSRMPALSVRGE